MVNLHFSLLPRWRGAAPVERAILAGDTETGVCLMAVEEGLDTGGVFACERLDGRTTGDRRRAADRSSAEIGSRLLVDALTRGLGDAHARRTASPPTPAKLDPADARARLDAPRRRDRTASCASAAPGRRSAASGCSRCAALPARPCPVRPASSVARPSRRATASYVLEVQPEGRSAVDGRAAWPNGARPRPATGSARDRSPRAARARRPRPHRARRRLRQPRSCRQLLAAADLADRDRAFVTELVYGTTRMRRACDLLVDRFVARAADLPVRIALRLGAYQLALPRHRAARRGGRDGRASRRRRHAGSSTRCCAGSPTAPIDVARRRDPPELPRLDRRPAHRRPRARRRVRRARGA